MGTTGINPSNAVTLTFSNSSGFSATEQAVRVQSDGTVIAGVPLYVIPSTGQIGQGTVSLVLTQSSVPSPPPSTPLTIQNLPALSTYGTELGQISHSFLIFEAMLHARRLNEFQAAQQLVGTSVHTASAQTVMQDLVNASNLARADVDNIMSNNGTVFSWGSVGGTSLQFNSTQLDAMDRIIAVYLTQQFLSSGSASASSPTSRSRTGKPPIRPELNFGSVGSLLTCLGSNTSACFMQAQEAVKSSPNPTDTSTAWLTGMKATLNLGGAGQDAALPGLALGFVHLSAGLDSLTHAVSDAATRRLAGSRAARRGVVWLLRAQEQDGSWFGRWGANYIYGTGAVVPALIAAGVRPGKPAIRRAVDWLESHQNPDGGWGEDMRSYDDPSLAGRGVSTASQTAWALLALLAAAGDGPPGASAEAGIRWLAEHQRPDGTWDEPEYTGTGFPGDFYLNYHLYRLVFPVSALGRYLSSPAPGDGSAAALPPPGTP